MKTTQEYVRKIMQRWGLSSAGRGFSTGSSYIQPVLYNGKEGILKVPYCAEEKRGSRLLNWWDGCHAAQVYKMDDNAVLMEDIKGDVSLKSLSMEGRDDEATEIICDVTASLHAYCNGEPPELVALDVWFSDLFIFAGKFGDTFSKAASVARELLNNQVESTVLHGDIHHGNILHSAERGWLVIDPKGLFGDRAFDYVNILCNPSETVALANGRFTKRIEIISSLSGIPKDRLLRWTSAWSALSAVWLLNDGMGGADLRISILEKALAEIPK